MSYPEIAISIGLSVTMRPRFSSPGVTEERKKEKGFPEQKEIEIETVLRFEVVRLRPARGLC